MALGFIVFSSLFYFVFWIRNRKELSSLRILPDQEHPPRPKKELFLSLMNIGFSVMPMGVAFFVEQYSGFTMRYKNVSDYGLLYFIFSIFVMLLVYDSYFYWIHRFFHHFHLRVHKTHHQFTNPTPFAAFAFNLVEGSLLNLSTGLILFIIPWHMTALLIYLFISSVTPIVLHLGYDPLPMSWQQHPLLKWINTPTHHSVHHQRGDCNFGFYFLFWDRLQQTQSSSCKSPPG